MTDEEKQKYIESQKHRYHNITDEQKQKYIEAQKHRYHNQTLIFMIVVTLIVSWCLKNGCYKNLVYFSLF